MNFKMKALVAAAVVATTMSGAANALTNNEIFLVATDTTGTTGELSTFGTDITVTGITGTSPVTFGRVDPI